MPKELDFENLRFCLDNYTPTLLYIRDCGGVREDGRYHLEGLTKVREDLAGKVLDFNKDDSGLRMIVDSSEVFNFPLNNGDYFKGFSLEYYRVRQTSDGIGQMVVLPTGYDPYDPNLPYPKSSILRNVFDNHLIEITFAGMVNLRFHSWWDEPHWKYWTVDKPNSFSETIYKKELESDD